MTNRTAALFIAFVLLAFGMITYDNLEGRKALLQLEREADHIGNLLRNENAVKQKAIAHIHSQNKDIESLKHQVKALALEAELATLKLNLCAIFLKNCEAENAKCTSASPGMLAGRGMRYDPAAENRDTRTRRMGEGRSGGGDQDGRRLPVQAVR